MKQVYAREDLLILTLVALPAHCLSLRGREPAAPQRWAQVGHLFSRVLHHHAPATEVLLSVSSSESPSCLN